MTLKEHALCKASTSLTGKAGKGFRKFEGVG